MKLITWEDPKKKSEAYTHLMRVFKVSRPTVSLAMSFKRNSLEAARMRHVAVNELEGKLLTDKDVDIKPTKVLDSKGNVTGVITI